MNAPYLPLAGTGGVPNLMLVTDHAVPGARQAYFELHTQIAVSDEQADALRPILDSEARTPDDVLRHLPLATAKDPVRLKKLVTEAVPPLTRQAPSPGVERGTGGVPNLLLFADYARPGAPVRWFQIHTRVYLNDAAAGATTVSEALALDDPGGATKLATLHAALVRHGQVTQPERLRALLKAALA